MAVAPLQQQQQQTLPAKPSQHHLTQGAAAGEHDLQLPAPAAPAPAGKAMALPALSSLHFATGSSGSAAADHLVGDPSFDSAAYAAYQALFDVPAGQYAPALQRNVTATPLQSTPEQSAEFAAIASDFHLCFGRLHFFSSAALCSRVTRSARIINTI
jgi:hypothetical protein